MLKKTFEFIFETFSAHNYFQKIGVYVYISNFNSKLLDSRFYILLDFTSLRL